jgi:hypothetical protein
LDLTDKAFKAAIINKFKGLREPTFKWLKECIAAMIQQIEDCDKNRSYTKQPNGNSNSRVEKFNN